MTVVEAPFSGNLMLYFFDHVTLDDLGLVYVQKTLRMVLKSCQRRHPHICIDVVRI